MATCSDSLIENSKNQKVILPIITSIPVSRRISRRPPAEKKFRLSRRGFCWAAGRWREKKFG